MGTRGRTGGGALGIGDGIALAFAKMSLSLDGMGSAYGMARQSRTPRTRTLGALCGVCAPTALRVRVLPQCVGFTHMRTACKCNPTVCRAVLNNQLLFSQ